MSEIRDVLYIKSIERSLGRKLSQTELDMEERDGEVQLNLGNGESIYIAIPRLRFPEDLLHDFASIPSPINKLVPDSLSESWKLKKNYNSNTTVYEKDSGA